MGEVVRGEFALGPSQRAEAAERRVSHSTVWLERKGDELPYAKVRGTNGKVYNARQLTAEQRRTRTKRIKMLLNLGYSVTAIVETLDVSRGVVSRVAESTPKRRKVSRASRRAWKNRGTG
ncbi:hypothetical protein [Mycobacterium sp. 29Ha]|uniref:hypothetical protein n=1 Tax=Mycobacterium sp. 29Ha TaxID=2939268 RepID=UPI0029393AB2|nr:hypothetical protein [Mycobacterium sp. 29Ha]MDV3134107.1 hypothetical protein [Mycobacterium sp. 29Ha]